MAKSKSGEFYSFDEVLRRLNIDENRLKRLVSEGEIRAFREGGEWKFKRGEIDGLAGRSGRGSQTSETSLTEISLEDDDSQPTVNVGAGVGDTLSDDLLSEPDLTATGGMKTAEISSQDTFIDEGDVGMSTEPIDFTDDADLTEDDEVEDIGAGHRSRAGGARRPQQRRIFVDRYEWHEDDGANVPVFFGTCRSPSRGLTFRRRFSHRRSGSGLRYGMAEVRIPQSHVKGNLERPTWFQTEKPGKHFTIRRFVRHRSQQDWMEALTTQLSDAGADDGLMFVHGYNVSFVNSMYRTAQLAFDLSFQGAPLAFSWPSRGRKRSYLVDEQNATWAVAHLARVLEELSMSTSFTRIHILAHSMGARIVTEALSRLKRTGAKLFSQVVLAAPDIDADVFRQLASAFAHHASRTTMYVSSNDVALRWASRLRGGYRRAGEVGRGGPTIVKGVDTVDSTHVDTSFLNHGGFARNRAIIDDMKLVIGERRPPPRPAIDAVPPRKATHWAFPRSK